MATPNPEFVQKSFWQRPEGVTGTLFLVGLLLGGGYLLYTLLPYLLIATQNVLYLSGMLIVLAGIIYMVLDPKMRNLIGNIYKSMMRSITGIFVNINPIAILKNYVEDLESNLRKMSKQIGNLRGQMRQLSGLMEQNKVEIDKSMKLASQAQKENNTNQVTLSARKAARLQEANEKYGVLHNKMDLLYKVLTKMYENSETLIEDTKDQVTIKEQEYTAIRAGHNAMQQAMSILKGDSSKKLMFDQSIEAINNDLAMKVGEMERFMDMSGKFMDSIDLQNGVFEEEGIKMLDSWERDSLILTNPKLKNNEQLDLNQAKPDRILSPKSNEEQSNNKYDHYFD
ncbi:MAG: hypothetical protein KA101_01055 [Saprospiraceae bacterium]|nr:hypothetical protein [Saprospiraceae bacterium]